MATPAAGAASAEPKWMRFVCGGVASMTAEVATFPIDTVKVRMQIQGSAAVGESAAKAYRNPVHCAVSIWKEEGPSVIYRGVRPALLRQASYSSLRMGIYEPIRGSLVQMTGVRPDAPIPVWLMAVAGGTAGSIGAICFNPADVLKVRMQAASKQGSSYSTGLVKSLVHMFREEGLVGVWKVGLIPNAQRAFVVNAAELASYDAVKQWVLRHQMMGDHVWTHLFCSLVAGGVAALVSSPVDVAKTRLMSQNPLSPVKYSGLVDCMITSARTEGVLSLYRGLLPNWLRIGPWCAVFFVSYEQLRKYGNAWVATSK